MDRAHAVHAGAQALMVPTQLLGVVPRKELSKTCLNQ